MRVAFNEIEMIARSTLREELDALFDGRQDLVDDPYPLYHRMRVEAPVMAYGDEVLVTRYGDVERVLRDHADFSKRNYRGSRVTSFADRLGPEEAEVFNQISAFKELWMSAMDPPAHSRNRGLVHKVFTPRRIAEMRPRVEAITSELIDAAGGKEDIEVLHDFAYGLPLYVIAAMLGAPRQDWDSIRDWSSRLAAF